MSIAIPASVNSMVSANAPGQNTPSNHLANPINILTPKESKDIVTTSRQLREDDHTKDVILAGAIVTGLCISAGIGGHCLYIYNKERQVNRKSQTSETIKAKHQHRQEHCDLNGHEHTPECMHHVA